jgi:hypothetical protein
MESGGSEDEPAERRGRPHMTSTGSERTRKILIDEYSLATVPIEMFFDQTPPKYRDSLHLD